jgi:hypothetical protein
LPHCALRLRFVLLVICRIIYYNKSMIEINAAKGHSTPERPAMSGNGRLRYSPKDGGICR